MHTLLAAAADAVMAAFDGHDEWGPSGHRADQYVSDVVADEAVRAALEGSGLRILSEESGLDAGPGPVVVVDPLDGSTNASRRLPWYATSLCVVDDDGPWVAVVHDHGTGSRYDAVRGHGARLDGHPLPRRESVPLEEAIISVNGLPPAAPGWWQFRCMGASALDLCAVADGRFDGACDFDGGLAPWDYLGGMLVCTECGVKVDDAEGRDLVVVDPAARRSPVAGPPGLFEDLLELRRSLEPPQ